MTLPDLGALLRALVEGGVRFVIVGGVAVSAHAYVRATEDVDLVPDPGHENLDQLVNVLVGLDAHLSLRPSDALGPEVRRALRRGRNLSATTSLGDLDVIKIMPGVPSYRALLADAMLVDVAGVSVRICSREHLTAMKRARGHPIDLADLERLEPGGEPPRPS